MKTMARKRKLMTADEFRAKYIDTMVLTPEEQADVDEYSANLDTSLRIAVALLDARKNHSWTQQDLSRITGLNQSEISKLEGPDANPTLLTLGKVARALNLEVRLVPREG